MKDKMNEMNVSFVHAEDSNDVNPQAQPNINLRTT